MVETVVFWLRRINDAIAIIIGVALLATVLFILTEITFRLLGGSLGGTDEVSGYVMAGATSWGMAYALITLAHVRIDLVRLQLKARGRALMDIFSMISLTGVTIVVAIQTWPVLSKTLASGARANTPLETPLWIPQVIWWGGWVWFAVSASALLICAIIMVLKNDYAQLETVIGVGQSEEQEL